MVHLVYKEPVRTFLKRMAQATLNKSSIVIYRNLLYLIVIDVHKKEFAKNCKGELCQIVDVSEGRSVRSDAECCQWLRSTGDVMPHPLSPVPRSHLIKCL